MWHILFSILTFLVAISIIVGVHEFGHFIVARLFGIKVLRFSIGFGKILWRTQNKKGTEYALSLIPFGGYVKLLDSREEEVPANEMQNAFDQRPIYQRFFVLIAGAIFNFILGILTFWIVFASGIVVIKPVIGSVQPNSLAAQAKLQAGDEIVAINQHKTPGWTSVVIALMRNYGDTKTLTISVVDKTSQQLKQRTINITPNNWRLNDLQPDTLSSLGIKPAMPVLDKKTNEYTWLPKQLKKVQYSPGKALIVATQNAWGFLTFNLVVLYKMATGVISLRGLGGPVSIFQAVSTAAGQGVLIFINFLGILNISIGLLNILPIPALDGGQIAYLLYERIRGKPLSASAQVLAFRLGVILLLILMTQALINDILRL